MRRFGLIYTQTIINLIQIEFYLNKINNGLSIKPKHLINRMFNSILAVLFLIRLLLITRYQNW